MSYSRKEVSIYNYSIEDFHNVLMTELLINTRLVIENERNKKLHSLSMGVDVCCRVIIEICALLTADQKGEFTDKQKALFFLQYLSVEINRRMKKGSTNDEIAKASDNSYHLLLSEYKRITGCDDETAVKMAKTKIKEILVKYGEPSIPHFTSFIKKYLGEDYLKYREQLNVFIHPSYIGTKNNTELLPGIESIREKIINRVLTLAYQFISVDRPQAYLKTRWNDEVVDAFTIQTIDKIEKESHLLCTALEKNEEWKNTKLKNFLPRRVISFSVKRMCETLNDCILCESLGYKAQVMAKAKPFLEFVSFLGYFMDQSERINLDVISFFITSKLSFQRTEQELFHIIEKVNRKEPLNTDENEKYENHIKDYKDWYDELKKENCISVAWETFIENAPKNRIYYIGQDINYKYINLLREQIMHYLSDDEKVASSLLSYYFISSMIGHVSAFKSTFKENKMFWLIPNMISFLTAVLKPIDDVYSIGYFIRGMEEIKNDIFQHNKETRLNQMSEKYKAF